MVRRKFEQLDVKLQLLMLMRDLVNPCIDEDDEHDILIRIKYIIDNELGLVKIIR
jgi:hypothetical protein